MRDPRTSEADPAAALELGAARERVRAEIERRLLDGRAGELGAVLTWHLKRPGKMLRPGLSLWMQGVLGGEPEPVLPLAVGLELIHTASLITDDIQDDDAVRRGRPSLWKRFGVPRALLAADRLLAEAQCALAELEGPPAAVLAVTRAVALFYRDAAIGQALDLERGPAVELGLARYEALARSKTGSAFAVALTAPALLAQRPEPTLAALDRAGQELGLCFQILDDLLDAAGRKDGRAEGSDVAEGKLSALVALTVEELGAEHPQVRALGSVLDRPREQTAPSDVARVLALFERAGARERAFAWAQRLRAAAVAHFAEALPAEPGASAAFDAWTRGLVAPLGPAEER